eukprot:m.100177 g.100177  ORF g.100177 m.100177 type:complete len:306 (+) comp8922_c0_seq5:90-1007(+)
MDLPSYAATESTALAQLPLATIAAALEDILRGNFATADVTVVDCPDLREPPFRLAAAGLCGSPRIADVGGVPNLVPSVDRSKIYNLRHIACEIGLPNAFFLGAGAGSHRLTGVNSELMPNTNLATNEIHSRYAKVSQTGEAVLSHYESNEFSLLCNLLASEGKTGKVLHVKAHRRTGDKNFVSCMREGLFERFAEPIGLGGVFVIKQGHAKLHVMPDFSKDPLESEKKVNDWLKFYDASAELTCLSVLVSRDPGLDLRLEHTHCFSEHGDGGHYHCDTTPEKAEYEGYFVLAEQLFRVDRPPAAK